MNKRAVAVILGVMMPGSAVAEPKILGDGELDSITAAGVLVDVNSIAAALGDFANAATDSRTFAFNGKTLDLGVGVTIGQALACCGDDADVEVGSAVLGIGDIVHGATQRTEYNGHFLAHALSVGFIVAIAVKEPFVALRAEHQTMLAQLRAALADFHF